MASPKPEDNQRDIFLSIVSHELKTPITSIQGFTQAMQRKMNYKLQNFDTTPTFSKDEIQRYCENLEIILKQIKRMNRLVDDLLDVSVIEKGIISYSFATVDLKILVLDIVKRMQEHSQLHRIRFYTSLESCKVLGDEGKLDQLFSNVLSNAIKFSPSSETISISIEEDSSFYTVSIQDSGIGIPSEELPHIFDLYYRGKDVGSRKLSGLGLGLYLSKKIIEIHKGSITAQSKVGLGTTITIKIPKNNEDIDSDDII